MSIEFRVYRQAVAIIRDYASTIIDSNTDYEESLNLVTHLRRRRP